MKTPSLMALMMERYNKSQNTQDGSPQRTWNWKGGGYRSKQGADKRAPFAQWLEEGEGVSHVGLQKSIPSTRNSRHQRPEFRVKGRKATIARVEWEEGSTWDIENQWPLPRPFGVFYPRKRRSGVINTNAGGQSTCLHHSWPLSKPFLMGDSQYKSVSNTVRVTGNYRRGCKPKAQLHISVNNTPNFHRPVPQAPEIDAQCWWDIHGLQEDWMTSGRATVEKKTNHRFQEMPTYNFFQCP